MNSENLTAYQQLMALDHAMMAAILEVPGEVTVSREAVSPVAVSPAAEAMAATVTNLAVTLR